jgi:hypothetical protein
MHAVDDAGCKLPSAINVADDIPKKYLYNTHGTFFWIGLASIELLIGDWSEMAKSQPD